MNVTSAWIGEHYKEKFIADPDYSLKSLQAKLRVLKLIEGAHKAQYKKIYEYLLEMKLEVRMKPILTMMKTIRTKIMLLIVNKKEEADKWQGMLCPKIKKKLDVNIKDSLRCVPSHAGGDKYQVECGPSSQHMVDLVENSCSCKN
ncbi:hypothetical protein Gotur_019071 [Gossypium turneri]